MYPGRYSNNGTWNNKAKGGVEYLGFDLEQSGTPHARKKNGPYFVIKKNGKRIKIVELIIENSRRNWQITAFLSQENRSLESKRIIHKKKI